MTEAEQRERAQRRVDEYSRRFISSYGGNALLFAYHAALPVALTPELLHLIRINFFLDPQDESANNWAPLPYWIEFDFLVFPLCHQVDEGLYEIEPAVRELLLEKLVTTYRDSERVREIATLLWQYIVNYAPWEDRIGFERAQQLTALNFLAPEKALDWLKYAEVEAAVGKGVEREWYLVMRQGIEKQTRIILQPPHKEGPQLEASLADAVNSAEKYLRPNQDLALSNSIAREIRDSFQKTNLRPKRKHLLDYMRNPKAAYRVVGYFAFQIDPPEGMVLDLIAALDAERSEAASERKETRPLWQLLECFRCQMQYHLDSEEIELIKKALKSYLDFMKSDSRIDNGGQCKKKIELLIAELPKNPFVPQTGKIEDITSVFGRESEIEQIFEILNSGSGVALIGESGIGKSSLLNLIKIKAESQLNSPRKAIYVDCGNVITDNDFYYGLCSQLGINCDYDHPPKGFLLKQELEKHRLLLLLDGLRRDMVWEGFTAPVRNLLRSLANTGLDAPLRLLVAANKNLTQLFADGGANSPFEKVCIEVELKPWDQTTIRNFINHRLADTNIHFSESDIQEAIKKSKGNPQKLMMFCYETYKKYC